MRLPVASKVTFDFEFDLFGLNNRCSHVSLASKGLRELNDTTVEEISASEATQ